MTTTPIKTCELTGPALDWAVAKCEGFDLLEYEKRRLAVLHRRDDAQPRGYRPSTDWSQGGPLIAREQISLWPNGTQPWDASVQSGKFVESGPTPLIAAMRCYCVSKLGDTVDFPNLKVQK